MGAGFTDACNVQESKEDKSEEMTIVFEGNSHNFSPGKVIVIGRLGEEIKFPDVGGCSRVHGIIFQFPE